MSELVRRARATEKTLAKYRFRPFDWRGATCIHLARTQMRNMGHRPPPIPRFWSIIGARRALADRGLECVADLLDQIGLPRIPPGMMLVGDLAAVPGQAGMDAIFVNAGGKLLGWREDHDGGIVPVADALPHVTAAWRL